MCHTRVLILTSSATIFPFQKDRAWRQVREEQDAEWISHTMSATHRPSSTYSPGQIVRGRSGSARMLVRDRRVQLVKHNRRSGRARLGKVVVFRAQAKPPDYLNIAMFLVSIRQAGKALDNGRCPVTVCPGDRSASEYYHGSQERRGNMP